MIELSARLSDKHTTTFEPEKYARISSIGSVTGTLESDPA